MCYDAIALWCSNLKKQLNDVDVGNRRETKIVLRKLKKIVLLVNISSYSIFTSHSFRVQIPCKFDFKYRLG